MKKMFIMILLMVLLIPSYALRIYADDKPEGCELDLVSNLRIENDKLAWDPVEGATQYEVAIPTGSYSGRDNYTTENTFDVLSVISDWIKQGRYGIQVPGEFTFAVYTVVEGNNCNHDNAASITAKVADRADIINHVFTNKEQSQEGGTVTFSDGLTMQDVTVDITPKDGYYAEISYGSEKSLIWGGSDTITIPIDLLYSGEYNINFVSDCYIITIDVSPDHSEVANEIYDIFNSIYPGKIRVEGSLVKIMFNFEGFPGIYASSVGLALNQQFIFYRENGIHNNEELAIVHYLQNINSFSDIEKITADEKTISESDYMLYALWAGYQADGAKTWIKDDKGTLTYTFTRNIDDKGYQSTIYDYMNFEVPSTYECFLGVTIDGKELTKDTDYTIAEGSLKLILNDSYLNTLAVGEHEVVALFAPAMNDFYSDFLKTDSTSTDTLTCTAKLTVTEKEEEKEESSHTSNRVYQAPRTGVEY